MKRFFLVSLILLLFVNGFAVDTKNDYEKNLKKFYESIQIIKRYYVNDIKFKSMIDDAIKGMLDGLDVHSTYMTKQQMEDLQRDTQGKYGGVGMVVTIKDGVLTCVSPIENGPSDRLGIKTGDKIIKINGKDTSKMSLEDAVNLLRGKPGTSVKVTIFRESNKTIKNYTIIREIIKLPSVKYSNVENIGYIRISDFKATTAKDLKKAIKDLQKQHIKGIILDLRGNPGGLLSAAINVSDLFLAKGKTIVSVKGRNGQEFEKYKSLHDPLTTLPMVVLINEGSASAAEIVSGALKDNHRAILVGERSYGKGSVQRLFPLSDGSAIKLTIAKYYTPADICIHGIGIEPDIVAHEKIFTEKEAETIDKIKNGKYIEDYLKDMQTQLETLKRNSKSFENTKEGFNKLKLETYAVNPTNLEILKNKLKANNIDVSRPLLRILVNDGLFKQKYKNSIADPIMDSQLQMAIGVLKTAVWESEK